METCHCRTLLHTIHENSDAEARRVDIPWLRKLLADACQEPCAEALRTEINQEQGA